MTQLGVDTYRRIGPTFLVFGNLINWFLHGVLTVQLYLYYLAFPKDKAWTKAAVYTVYALETIQVIGLAIVMSTILVGSPIIFDDQYFGLSFSYFSQDKALLAHGLLVDIVGALVPLIAQCIYAHRIRIINGMKIVPRLIVALAVLQVIAAILTELTLPFASCVWTGLNAVNDAIIAVVMVRGLLKHKTLSAYTRSKVVNLIFLIIATGILTVTFNLIALVLLATQSSIPLFVSTTILIFMPKLYANSILVMLNNRMTVANTQKATPNMESNVLSTFVVAGSVQDTRYQIAPSSPSDGDV